MLSHIVKIPEREQQEVKRVAKELGIPVYAVREMWKNLKKHGEPIKQLLGWMFYLDSQNAKGKSDERMLANLTAEKRQECLMAGLNDRGKKLMRQYIQLSTRTDRLEAEGFRFRRLTVRTMAGQPRQLFGQPVPALR